jgi:hypothetical protein
LVTRGAATREARRASAGKRFVQGRVYAGVAAFVDAWDRHGGAAGDAQITSWIEVNAD